MVTSRCRRRGATLAALAFVLAVALLVPARSEGQGAGSPSVAPPVAPTDPISSADATPPPLDVVTVSATRDPDGTTARVSIGFAGPFTLPSSGYRLSVSVGDPLGQRTRASLVPASGTSTGTVEVGNGLTFRDAGTTTVELAEQTVDLVVPVDKLGPGAALWVDGELTGDEPTTVTSAYYSYDALVGVSLDGAAPGGTWGWTATPGGRRFADPVLVATAPPTAATRNSVVAVDFPDAVPDTLIGQPVVSANAYLGIRLSGATQPTVDGAVAIDRTTGSVVLLDGTGTPVAAAAEGADRSWLVEGLSAPSAAGPASVTIEPEVVATLLGGAFDRDLFAVDLSTAFALGDGRVVTVSGVATTLTWLDQLASTVEVVEPTTTQAVVASTGDDATVPVGALVAVAVGVLALVGAAVALAVVARRRRRRRPVVPPPVARPPGEAPTPPVAVPEPEPEPEPAGASARRRERLAPRGRAPDEVLAELEAELAELSDRVERLDRRPSAGDGG